MEVTRCFGKEPGAMQDYHDRDWGVPVRDERLMFELLVLEGAQAGLSWSTILNRREGYKKVFDDFDVERVARYTPEKMEALRSDDRIIRNRLKIASAVRNARATLGLYDKGTTLVDFFWDFVEGVPIQNEFKSWSEVPAETALSRKISKELKKLGFNFVGPTIVYAHMQSIGMVNDHLVPCFRHEEVKGL